MPAKRYRVTLSQQEREELQGLVNKGQGQARRLRRARILLMADEAQENGGWKDADIAQALGLPPPPEVDMDQAKQVLSAGMLSYSQESRRIDNRRLINELGVQLQYPDFTIGLAACLDALIH